MQMSPLVAEHCFCQQGKALGHPGRDCWKKDPTRGLSIFVGRNGDDVWDSDAFRVQGGHDRQDNMGGKYCLRNGDWWPLLVFLALWGLRLNWAFFIWWQVGYVIDSALSGCLQPMGGGGRNKQRVFVGVLSVGLHPPWLWHAHQEWQASLDLFIISGFGVFLASTLKSSLLPKSPVKNNYVKLKTL